MSKAPRLRAAALGAGASLIAYLVSSVFGVAIIPIFGHVGYMNTRHNGLWWLWLGVVVGLASAERAAQRTVAEVKEQEQTI